MDIRKIPYQSTWDIRHKVMWPNEPIDYVILPNDKNGIHFGLFISEKLVSIVSVFVEDQSAQFRKFATLEEEQGKGFGSKLLRFLFEELAFQNIEKVWCNARLDKANFYERFGLYKTAETFSKGGIDYVIMEKYLIA